MKENTKAAPTATFAEKMDIHEILSDRLHSIEGSNLFRYEEGWSDLRVSQVVRSNLTASPTAKIRKDMFGQLMYAQGGRTKSEHEKRITALENQLRRLIDWMNPNAEIRAELIGDVDTNKVEKLDTLQF